MSIFNNTVLKRIALLTSSFFHCQSSCWKKGNYELCFVIESVMLSDEPQFDEEEEEEEEDRPKQKRPRNTFLDEEVEEDVCNLILSRSFASFICVLRFRSQKHLLDSVSVI